MIYGTHRRLRERDYNADTHNSLDDLALVVKLTTRALRDHVDSFDAIIVTGLSGITVGVPVSLVLGKPLVILRKAGEESHAVSYSAEENFVGEKYLRKAPRLLWLDDFVSSGDTRDRVQDAVVRWAEARDWVDLDMRPRIVAAYLYTEEEFIPMGGLS